MIVSIAMATFNGETYLQEQLESFATQSRAPDELVIVDDGSTDSTLEVIRNFARRVRFGVRVYSNRERLGYARNFERAIQRCTGDVICLADQDDYWFPRKLATVEEILLRRPSAWVLVNDAEITDSALQGTGLTVAGQLTAAGLRNENMTHGCCMAFRSQLKRLLSPMPSVFGAHDGWINTLGLTLGCRVFTPEVLQYYRRHGTNTSQWWVTSNTTAVSRWKLLRQQVSGIGLIHPARACDTRLAQQLAMKNRLQLFQRYLEEQLPSPEVLSDALLLIDSACTANNRRKSIQALSRIPRCVHAVCFYFRGGYDEFQGWRSLARDVWL